MGIENARGSRRLDCNGNYQNVEEQNLAQWVDVDPIALAAVDTAGGVFAWQNQTGTAVLVDLLVDVTAYSSSASTLDAGVAANATTLNDTLIDGQSMASAAKVISSGVGTNAGRYRKVAAGEWVTGSVASGASSGLVGWAHIRYKIAKT